MSTRSIFGYGLLNPLRGIITIGDRDGTEEGDISCEQIRGVDRDRIELADRIEIELQTDGEIRRRFAFPPDPIVAELSDSLDILG